MPMRRCLKGKLTPDATSKSTEDPRRTDPASGRTSPVIRRRIVVFPDPEGPNRTPISAPNFNET